MRWVYLLVGFCCGLYLAWCAKIGNSDNQLLLTLASMSVGLTVGGGIAVAIYQLTCHHPPPTQEEACIYIEPEDGPFKDPDDWWKNGEPPPF